MHIEVKCVDGTEIILPHNSIVLTYNGIGDCYWSDCYWVSSTNDTNCHYVIDEKEYKRIKKIIRKLNEIEREKLNKEAEELEELDELDDLDIKKISISDMNALTGIKL